MHFLLGLIGLAICVGLAMNGYLVSMLIGAFIGSSFGIAGFGGAVSGMIPGAIIGALIAAAIKNSMTSANVSVSAAKRTGGAETEPEPSEANTSRPSAGTTRFAPSARSDTPPTIYVVVTGDSLASIAKRFYGDAKKWKPIYEANADKIKDYRIQEGQVLIIPL